MPFLAPHLGCWQPLPFREREVGHVSWSHLQKPQRWGLEVDTIYNACCFFFWLSAAVSFLTFSYRCSAPVLLHFLSFLHLSRLKLPVLHLGKGTLLPLHFFCTISKLSVAFLSSSCPNTVKWRRKSCKTRCVSPPVTKITNFLLSHSSNY